MITAVESLRALLPRAVLLAIPAGKKGPSEKDWQKRTLADMERPAYLASLNHGGNVGVLLGKASDGLCTVDLDDAQAADAFFTCNPELAGALRTTRVRGCNVWLRIVGEFPKSGKLKALDAATGKSQGVGEWRADGNQTVIHGAAMDTGKGETRPTAYRRIVDAAPVEMAFDAIQWPLYWRLPWRPEIELDLERKLTERHGAAFSVSERGRVALNPMFFVARYAGEHDVLFEPGEGRFYGYHPEAGLWRPATAATVT